MSLQQLPQSDIPTVFWLAPPQICSPHTSLHCGFYLIFTTSMRHIALYTNDLWLLTHFCLLVYVCPYLSKVASQTMLVFDSSVKRHLYSMLAVWVMYLCCRRLQCMQPGCSHSGSRWVSPHSGPGSGRVSRNCCSDRGNRVEPRVWSWPSPPGPEWRRSAAESEYSPGSPFASKLCLLTNKENISVWWCKKLNFPCGWNGNIASLDDFRASCVCLLWPKLYLFVTWTDNSAFFFFLSGFPFLLLSSKTVPCHLGSPRSSNMSTLLENCEK